MVRTCALFLLAVLLALPALAENEPTYDIKVKRSGKGSAHQVTKIEEVESQHKASNEDGKVIDEKKQPLSKKTPGIHRNGHRGRAREDAHAPESEV
jgi:hypothetical protein